MSATLLICPNVASSQRFFETAGAQGATSPECALYCSKWLACPGQTVSRQGRSSRGHQYAVARRPVWLPCFNYRGIYIDEQRPGWAGIRNRRRWPRHAFSWFERWRNSAEQGSQHRTEECLYIALSNHSWLVLSFLLGGLKHFAESLEYFHFGRLMSTNDDSR